MTERKLRFALFGNVYQPRKSASIETILASLAARGGEVMMERDFYEFLMEGCKTAREDQNNAAEGREIACRRALLEGIRVFDGSDFEADFALSLGGDGTFLRTASMTGAKEIPILGINTGRLGFLADVSSGDIEHTIAALYSDDYSVETRSVIRLETDGEELAGYPCALNDVAILKRDNASMITIHAAINGETLATYQADGLIMSTPTGSTAYSLSVGGPIIVPGTHVFSLTPVAPHSLNVRPIVVGEDSVLELTVESRTHNFLVALDGRSESLHDSTRLTLRRAPYRVQVIKRAGTRYFRTLREKMMWGADQRG